ncbi:MAG: FAD-dependent oxidoreductase [Pirellulaceae bacterium]
MSDRKRVLIVGGVAGGASAATRCRRLSEEAEIVLFERGAYVSFANCGLPYHISGDIRDRERLLVQTPEGLRNRYNLDVRVQTEVLSIDREKREIVARDHVKGREYTEHYDALILSPGAEPVRPHIPGSDHSRVMTLRNMADMDRIIEAVDARDGEQRALVVGGGYIGLEMTEALRQRGLEVTLVELADQVMAPVDREMAAPLHQELKLHGVDLRLKTSVTELRDKNGHVSALLNDGDTLDCSAVIMAIGVKPEVTLAREAGLEIGELGGIRVDGRMRTSDPDIYALGDAVEVRHFVDESPALIPLAGPANRQGRVAADNIFGRDSTYNKTQGTAICKVFNLAVGGTGLNEKTLSRNGMSYEKVYVHPASHAGYYPGATPVNFKLLFDPRNGRVLGAQAVGASGVDKRIDVIAMAIRGRMTVFDLQEAELAYAPPYGSAKDVINYAGFVAGNSIQGDVKLCHVEDVLSPKEDQMVLDVRTDEEVAAGAIPGAKHIPVDKIRERVNELPRDKEILTYCRVGQRAYLATRILDQLGFRTRDFTGGYTTYRMATNEVTGPPAGPTDMRDDSGAEEDADKEEKRDETEGEVVTEIDARGLQCPGPIQQLARAMEGLNAGQVVRVTATDAGFAADAPAWCDTTGNRLVHLASENGCYVATVAKRRQPAPASSARTEAPKKMTIVVFSNDWDRVVAAFIIANGAAAMGLKPTLFFTFWGLNVLRRDPPPQLKKNVIENLFGWMMPRGPDKLALSKMHMAGMGLGMMKNIMKKKNVASLPELISDALKADVKLVGCTMSMDLMGIHREELIDGVETGGVAMYLSNANQGAVNLFI